MNPVPLFDVEIERSLVASALIDGEAAQIVADVANCFEDKDARKVAQVIEALVRGGMRTDPLTVQNALGGGQQASDLVTDLLTRAADVVSADTHAAIVQRDWQRREARRTVERHMTGILNKPDNISEQIAAMAAALDNISPLRAGTGMRTLGQVVTKALGNVERLVETGETSGISTGWKSLNRWFKYPVGELSIVGARPSMGKSSFVLDSLKRMGREGVKAVLFSLEDGEDTIGERSLWQETQLNQYTVRKHVEREGYGRLLDVRDNLEGLPVRVFDLGGLTVPAMRQLAREARRDLGGLDIVLIDHGGHIVYDGGSNEVERIGRMLKTLVAWIKDEELACLMAWQLSRDVAKRDVKRPTMTDLRDSGHLDQDARRIFFLHSEAYYKRTAENPKTGVGTEDMEIIIDKNTSGSVAIVPFKFNRSTMSFYEVDRHATDSLPRPQTDARSWHDDE